jgi:hypothetical protein
MSIAREDAFKPRGGAPRGNRNARKHGLATLKRASRELGARAFDGRTRIARLTIALRNAVVADLGGEEVLTQAKAILVDDVVRHTLWIDTIDGYLMSLQSIIAKRKKSLLPVLLQRNALVETRARLLQMLGLERRARQLPALHDYLANRSSVGKSESPPASPSHHDGAVEAK